MIQAAEEQGGAEPEDANAIAMRAAHQTNCARLLVTRVIDDELRDKLGAALKTICPYTAETVQDMFHRGTVPDYPLDEAWDAVREANDAIGARLAWFRVQARPLLSRRDPLCV